MSEHLCRDGTEGARADQRSHTGGTGGGQGAWGGAGREPGLSACSGAAAAAAANARADEADRTANRVRIEIERLRRDGTTTLIGLARGLTALGVPTPGRGGAWTHTTVARVIGRAQAGVLAL